MKLVQIREARAHPAGQSEIRAERSTVPMILKADASVDSLGDGLVRVSYQSG
jgi:hypothetical protein